MPRFYDSDDLPDDDCAYEDEQKYVDESHDECSDEESVPSIDDTLDFSVCDKDNTPAMEWARIKLGNSVLHVSNYGHVKPYGSLLQSSVGIRVPGTPFRVYQVAYDIDDFKNHYVHELVWLAFREKPPTGWHIRHKDDHTRHPRTVYSNALHNLDIYPDIVCPVVMST